MTTSDFLSLLTTHADKELIFEFLEGKYVPSGYHITEVKNVHIESVDCGGRPDAYDQTIVQLWHNESKEDDTNLTADKANAIFKKVDGVKPIRQDAPIFFEWGNAAYRTSVYDVTSFEVVDNQLIIKMFVPATVCKPKYELEVMGCSTDGCC